MKLIDKIPIEIHKEIHKYLYDLSELKKINKNYYYEEYHEYRYYFSQSFSYHGLPYYTYHYIIFENIICAYLFDNYKSEIYDYYIYDE